MEKKLSNKESMVGKEFETKSYGKCVVVYYGDCRDVVGMFNEPFALVKCTLGSLQQGAVKNPMLPSVFGKGYIGVGSYSTMNKRAYSLWISMLARAYDDKFHQKHQTYSDVEVCKEWLNFQNFAKWCYSNKFINYKDDKGRRYELDKDILVKGNKIYSPETCCFVPKDINLIFSNSTRTYPTGISKVNKGFVVYVNCYGVKKYIGTYGNMVDAMEIYKKEKKEYMKDVADKWHDKLDPRMYEALVNYEIEVTD